MPLLKLKDFLAPDVPNCERQAKRNRDRSQDWLLCAPGMVHITAAQILHIGDLTAGVSATKYDRRLYIVFFQHVERRQHQESALFRCHIHELELGKRGSGLLDRVLARRHRDPAHIEWKSHMEFQLVVGAKGSHGQGRNREAFQSSA